MKKFSLAKNFVLFRSKPFVWNLISYSWNDQKRKNYNKRPKPCKPGGRKFGIEINFVHFSIIRKLRNYIAYENFFFYSIVKSCIKPRLKCNFSTFWCSFYSSAAFFSRAAYMQSSESAKPVKAVQNCGTRTAVEFSPIDDNVPPFSSWGFYFSAAYVQLLVKCGVYIRLYARPVFWVTFHIFCENFSPKLENQS